MSAVCGDGIWLLSQIVECCAVSHIKVELTLFVLLPGLLGVVELFAVVVVTNKSRTIVTAEKQNEDGY